MNASVSNRPGLDRYLRNQHQSHVTLLPITALSQSITGRTGHPVKPVTVNYRDLPGQEGAAGRQFLPVPVRLGTQREAEEQSKSGELTGAHAPWDLK